MHSHSDVDCRTLTSQAHHEAARGAALRRCSRIDDDGGERRLYDAGPFHRGLAGQGRELLHAGVDPTGAGEIGTPTAGNPVPSRIEPQRLLAIPMQAAVHARPPGYELDVRTGIVDGEDLPMGGVEI